MLIEFSVENFMCFQNEVTFSFEAMEDLAKDKFYNPESRRDIGIEGIGLINTVNGIYGKNASGKSTLLRAFKVLFYLILRSHNFAVDDTFDFVECHDNNKPAIFKVTFVDLSNNQKKLYDYTVHLKGEETDAQVSFEELIDKSEQTDVTIFERTEGKERRFSFSEHSFLTDTNKESLNSVRQNHLALSHTTIQPFESIQRIFSNIQNDFMDVYLPRNGSPHPLGMIKGIQRIPPFDSKMQAELQSDEFKPFFLKELQEADFNIRDYEFGNNEWIFIDSKGSRRKFTEQSDGTQKYLLLLLDVKLHILDTGGLYIVDELEKALHPLLAMRFINLFKNPKTNPKHARLLFSSHDMMFLHQSVLNGDQIWFIDRNEDTQDTKLYSPADFDDFDPATLPEDYALGCYGAVPNTNWRS